MPEIARLGLEVDNRKGIQQVEQYDRSLGKLDKRAAGLTRSFSSLGASIAGGLALAALTRESARFQGAMAQSLAIMGDVTDQMRGEMSVAARRVGIDLNIGATQAAEAYFFLASAGLSAEQSVTSLAQVAAFAKAGMFDMATATDLATDAQSALGLVADDSAENLANLTRVTDVLVGANTLANASVQQFATALTSQSGAALRSYGIDLEEGVAVLAAFADQGIKAELAGNSLARVLLLLGKSARDNTEAFTELGVDVFDDITGEFNNLADVVADLENATRGMGAEQKGAALEMLGFEARVQAVILPLLGTSEAIREYEAALRSAGGVTQEIAEKQMQAPLERIGRASKAMTEEFRIVGDTILLGLVPAMEAVAAAAPVMTAFFGGLQLLAVDAAVGVGRLRVELAKLADPESTGFLKSALGLDAEEGFGFFGLGGGGSGLTDPFGFDLLTNALDLFDTDLAEFVGTVDDAEAALGFLEEAAAEVRAEILGNAEGLANAAREASNLAAANLVAAAAERALATAAAATAEELEESARLRARIRRDRLRFRNRERREDEAAAERAFRRRRDLAFKIQALELAAAIEAVAIYEQAATDIANALEGGFESVFTDGLEGFEDFAENVLDVFRKLTAQIAAEFAADKLGLTDLIDDLREGVELTELQGIGVGALAGFAGGRAGGPLGGVLAGGIAGAQFGGAPGAVIGAGVGLLTGIFSAGVSEMEQRAREMELARESFTDQLDLLIAALDDDFNPAVDRFRTTINGLLLDFASSFGLGAFGEAQGFGAGASLDEIVAGLEATLDVFVNGRPGERTARPRDPEAIAEFERIVEFARGMAESLREVEEAEAGRELERLAEEAARLREVLVSTFEDLSARGLEAVGDTDGAARLRLAASQRRELVGSPEELRALLLFVQALESTQLDNEIALRNQTDEIVRMAEDTVRVLDDMLTVDREALEVAATALQAQERTVDSLRGVVDTLGDFSDSLALSNLSPLSPLEQLAEARRQFDEILGAARGGDLDAARDLPGAARALLELRREAFASGPGFVAVFNEVTAAVEEVRREAASQLTVEERIQAELAEQTTSLADQITELERIRLEAEEAAAAQIDALAEGFAAELAAQEALLAELIRTTREITILGDAIVTDVDEPRPPDVRDIILEERLGELVSTAGTEVDVLREGFTLLARRLDDLERAANGTTSAVERIGGGGGGLDGGEFL